MSLKRVLFLVLFFSAILTALPQKAFADSSSSSSESDEPEPYSPDEFPEWSKKVRRAEIITLGSVPFTTLGVILAYGTYQYVKGESVSFPNPFDSSKSYDEQQIKMILGYSVAASCAIGLTDFMISFIKHKHTQHKLEKIRKATEQPTVTPITPEEAGNLMRQGTLNAQNAQQEEPASPTNSTSTAADEPKIGQGE